MAARTNKLKVLLSVGSATLGEYNLRTLTMVRIGYPVMEGTVEEDWTLSKERVVTY